MPYTPYDVDYSSLIYVWDINRQGVLDFDQLNQKRLDPYHQLDIRVDKKWFFNKWNLDVYIDIQNVYNFQTTLQPYVDVVRDDIGNPIISATDPTRYEVYQLENTSGTLLPSIGLIIEL